MDTKKEIGYVLDDVVMSREMLADKRKQYEEGDALAMSYLSTWVILEGAVKRIHGIGVKEELLPKILEWKDYLEDKAVKAPPAIPKTGFTLEPFSIPTQSSIEAMLGKCKNISEVLNSKEKYRKKRNAIAHKAEEFGRASTYRDYIRLIPVDNSLIFISFVSRLRAKRTDSLTNRFFLLSIRPV